MDNLEPEKHILRLGKRTVTMTVRETTDSVFIGMSTNMTGEYTKKEARTIKQWSFPILDRYSDGPRRMVMFNPESETSVEVTHNPDGGMTWTPLP